MVDCPAFQRLIAGIRIYPRPSIRTPKLQNDARPGSLNPSSTVYALQL